MLRLFSDCLDISEPNGDGWTVHAALKRSYNTENVPVSQNSITWLLRTTSVEKFVVCGPRTIWSGVQHAVRSFLVHERSNQVLHRLLGLSDDSNAEISASHATAFAHWLALRGSERELLPMMLKVGGFCQVQGFDWFEDDIRPSQFIRALPAIYAAWAVAFPNSIDKVEELIRLELEMCLEKLGWTRESFLDILSSNTSRDHNVSESEDGTGPRTCSNCQDCYGQEGYGLVQPARIKFSECVRTHHRLNCNCSNILHDCGPIDLHPVTYESQHEDDSDVDEEFFDAEADLDIIKFPHFVERDSDPFLDAATMLYRAQGKTWVGHYDTKEQLCATCFLLREKYIGEDGLGTERDFPPMPQSFEMYRADVRDCTIEVASN